MPATTNPAQTPYASAPERTTKPDIASSRRSWTTIALFLLLVPGLAHALFSRLGMSPTDDGFFIGMGRRILEGEVPHRDFLTPRPAGTGLLHLPVVLLGGDYTLWISRGVVWFQFACIAWIWTSVLAKLLKQSLSATEQFLLALLAFALTAHTFLLTPWPTIDGLWVASLGLSLCLRENARAKLLGYALVGSACVFKQNFVVLAPAFTVLLGDWRKLRYWVAQATPGAAYVLVIAAAGGLGDFVAQMRSHTEIMQNGVSSYVHRWYLYAGLFAVYFGLLVARRGLRLPVPKLPPGLSAALLLAGTWILLALPAAALVRGPDAFMRCSFVLFGMVVGALLYALFDTTWNEKAVVAGALVLATMWSVSISIGWNAPAFGSGLAVVYLLCFVRSTLSPSSLQAEWLRSPALSAALALLTIGCFGFARITYLYFEQPASKLSCPLDDVLPGGRLIKTNPTTFAYMSELRDLTRRYTGRKFLVVPEAAIYWVKAEERNPLPTDWPIDIEFPNPKLYRRMTDAVEAQRGHAVLFVAKYTAHSLPRDLIPIQRQNGSDPTSVWANMYEFVFYIKDHFKKTDETRFWEVYE